MKFERTMKAIFYNVTEGRLRAGWRILVFCVLFWCFSASIFFIRPLLGDIDKSTFLTEYRLLIVGVLTISAVLSVLIVRKFIDKRPYVTIGLHLGRGGWKDVLFGFALSGMMAGLFFISAMALGVVQFDSFNPQITGGTDLISWLKVMFSGILMLALVEMILVGFWEELVFRGYLFRNMKQGMGLILTIVISCLLYGLVHYTNPNATIMSSAIIVVLGFLRIYGVLLTNMLWLSMGMHIGWNFFQGPIFGFSVSGHESDTLLQISHSGPDWLSGGAFGPEGSIIILPIIILALLAMNQWSEWNLTTSYREPIVQDADDIVVALQSRS